MNDNNFSSELELCMPMLDACTPRLYQNNAFRITGLPVSASARQINRRVEDLKNAEEIGDAEDEHTHAFALEPVPSIGQIRDAAQRLQDPVLRIIDEFFWFWPKDWDNADNDEAISSLLAGNKEAAYTIWQSWLLDCDEKVEVVAQHNLAIMYHLVALDSEHHSTAYTFDDDQLALIAKYWKQSFSYWENVTDNETFWSLLSNRIRLLDEPERLTTGEARRMRKTFPQALDKINALLALEYATQNRLSLCELHVRYMQETHEGLDDIEKTLHDITEPLRMRVQNAVQTARTAISKPAQGLSASKDLLSVASESLKAVNTLLPASDHLRIDLNDSVVEAAVDCVLAYIKDNKSTNDCVKVLDKLHPIAHSQETKTRLSEERDSIIRAVEIAKYYDPIEQAIARIDRKSTIKEKLSASESELIGLLDTVEKKLGELHYVTKQCGMRVAYYVRGLSVDAWNINKDVALAMRAIKLANSLTSDPEARTRFSADIKQLRDLEAAEKERLIYETCWFCKKNKGVDEYAATVAMHGDVTRTPTWNGTKTNYRHLTIKVPRCLSCKEAHGKVGGTLGGAAAGAAAGTAIVPILGTIVGAVVGGFLGSVVDNHMRLPSGVGAQSTASEFPAVKEMRAKGWSFGEKPT